MNTRSDIFSFHRWTLLISRHWAENYKRYLLFLLAIGGLLLAWYSFIISISRLILVDSNMQFAAYMIGLYVTGCLYASTLFADLSSKREGLSYLALPASHLEKLLCALLFGVVFFFISYTLVYYLVDVPMTHLSNNILTRYPRYFPGTEVPVPASAVYNIFTAVDAPIPEKEMHFFLLSFFSVQAVFILGSVYFTRYIIIQSTITVLLCMLLIVVVQDRVVNLFLPKGWYNGNFSWIGTDREEHPLHFVFMPGWLGRHLTTLVELCTPVLIWTITYYRLKEKEI